MVVTREKIDEALSRVIDPHMKVNLFEMGMIRRVEIFDAGHVEIGMVFPCIGCPAWSLIQHDIKSEIGSVAGVENVDIKIDWDKPWARADMSDHAREHAQSHGYRI